MNELALGLICALLALSAFIGGTGLLANQRWSRRSQAAYLGMLSTGVADIAITLARATRSSLAELATLVLLATALALPCMPFLLEESDCWAGRRCVVNLAENA